ncbi:histone-lysine N-methyltransferase SETMAR [Gadus macrocephalus]|uniref:histone-lysine N-methyltransferase SETMAR n=1 Tax=Gadus macrocephalus TaxID=80720 RepID=UPI0028CB6CF0|nr:histone-lysine N-methyltransferase SETMAR [Gadus macrocephalus]
MLFQSACVVDLSKGQENVPITIDGDFNQVEYPAFQYSPGNVQGPGCEIDPGEITLPGCSCLSQSCVDESCSCLKIYGQAYDSSGLLLDRYMADGAYCAPVFECNALCACSEACSNRVVERGLSFRLQVFLTRERGWGVRTPEHIHQGSFVCEYAGEVIGRDEARRRQLSQGPGDNNYIIAVREHAGPASVTETFVDPARVGNVGRFLNHSCRPNLVMVPVRMHSALPHLALFACRDICSGKELTFDYSGGGSRDGDTSRGSQAAIEASRTHGLQRKACYCRAQNCSGFLPLDTSVLSNL